jgi:hypothetical protein
MQNMSDNEAHLRAARPEGDGEHRREHRRRTLKHARVVLSDSTVIDCKLRDTSEDGTHLIFGGVVSLPEEFRLHNTSDGTMVPVRLKWQRGLEAGVTFTGPAEPFHTLKP